MYNIKQYANVNLLLVIENICTIICLAVKRNKLTNTANE